MLKRSSIYRELSADRVPIVLDIIDEREFSLDFSEMDGRSSSRMLPRDWKKSFRLWSRSNARFSSFSLSSLHISRLTAPLDPR